MIVIWQKNFQRFTCYNSCIKREYRVFLTFWKWNFSTRNRCLPSRSKERMQLILFLWQLDYLIDAIASHWSRITFTPSPNLLNLRIGGWNTEILWLIGSLHRKIYLLLLFKKNIDILSAVYRQSKFSGFCEFLILGHPLHNFLSVSTFWFQK